MIVPASELVRTIQFGMNYFTIPMHFFALNSKIYYIKNETVTFYAESKKKGMDYYHKWITTFLFITKLWRIHYII